MADYYNPGHVQREARILQQLADAQADPARSATVIQRLVREAAKEHGHGEARTCETSRVGNKQFKLCLTYTCDRVGKGKGKIRCRTERG